MDGSHLPIARMAEQRVRGGRSLMKVHVLGIDLAKNVFQLHGVDRKGCAILARRVRREQLLKVLGELEPCLIGIEASTGAF
jgi:transposase